MLLTSFIRLRLLNELIGGGLPVTQAHVTVSNINDDLLTAAVTDANLSPPTGTGILAWIVQNLPAILALIEQLVQIINPPAAKKA